MSKGVNKVILIGNLTRDPETRFLNGGSKVCNFSLATSESWNDKQTGQKKETTEFHNIQAFGKLAEICGQYLKKGMQAYIEGSIVSNEVDKGNGDKRRYYSIRANSMQMLGGKKESSGPPPDNIGNRKNVDDFDFDDQIPF